MWLACSSLAPLSNELLCETGSLSHRSNCHSPQPPLSLSFAFSQPYPCSPLPCCGFSEPAHVVRCLTGLVVLVGFFFNSLVVGVPCSLIFWRFWLFIDFRLVVILLLVVQGSEWFLPTPPSWPELSHAFFCIRKLGEFISVSELTWLTEQKC